MEADIKEWLKCKEAIFLKGVIKEIKNVKFYLEERIYKKLMYDDNYSMEYILNFKKKMRKEVD